MKTNYKSLDYMRRLPTVENTINRYSATGSLEPGTEVFCLLANSFGYHIPCAARIVKVTLTGRVVVRLWTDGSKQAVVSQKAILWDLGKLHHL